MIMTKREFITRNFPEIHDIDARLDHKFVLRVKRELLRMNFYKKDTDSLTDSALIQILKIQGDYKKPQNKANKDRV